MTRERRPVPVCNTPTRRESSNHAASVWREIWISSRTSSGATSAAVEGRERANGAGVRVPDVHGVTMRDVLDLVLVDVESMTLCYVARVGLQGSLTIPTSPHDVTLVLLGRRERVLA